MPRTSKSDSVYINCLVFEFGDWLKFSKYFLYFCLKIRININISNNLEGEHLTFSPHYIEYFNQSGLITLHFCC